MGAEDQIREELEAVSTPGLTLINGRNLPTVEEGDPHARISALERDVIVLYEALLLAGRLIDKAERQRLRL